MYFDVRKKLQCLYILEMIFQAYSDRGNIYFHHMILSQTHLYDIIFKVLTSRKRRRILAVVSVLYEGGGERGDEHSLWKAIQQQSAWWENPGYRRLGFMTRGADIKPEPEVTRLLNRGNLSILCLFVRHTLT